MKDASLGLAQTLLANIRLGWKGLPGTNISLLQTFVNYGHKKFYNNGLGGNIAKLFFFVTDPDPK